jgi:hypothetical protein
MGRARSVARRATKVCVEDEIAHLRGLDLKGLRARWQSVFRRQPPPHFPRHLLFGVLAYRIQADELGDLDAATVRLLKQIASVAKVDALRLTSDFDLRRVELRPGTILMREWNGHSQRVMVLDGTFVWNGKTYDSLSHVAFAITGTRWNGPRFFGLRNKQPPGATE